MGKKRYRLEKGKLEELPEKKKEPKAPTTVENDATGFVLYIPRHINDKIMHWVNKSKYEVSGFGSLEYDEKEHYFVVTDVCLLKQKVSATSTELDPHAIGKAMYRLRDKPGALKWHWHSHVDMNVFWSSDDMEVIRSLGQQGWIVASVFNKKKEIRSAFYTTTQVLGKAHDIFKDNLETVIYYNMPEEQEKALDKEYDELVEVDKPVTKTINTPTTSVYGMNEYWDEYDYECGELRELGAAPDRDEAPKPEEYNEWGYSKVGQYDWLYNPLYDQDLKDEKAQLLAIDEMTQEEINFLREKDKKFQELLAKYIVSQAKEVAHA
jgi:hypothetical protein